MLDKIVIELPVVLGGTVMPVRQLLHMGRSAVIKLNATGNGIAILADDVRIAKGQVIVQGDHFAMSITEILKRRPSCAKTPGRKAA